MFEQSDIIEGFTIINAGGICYLILVDIGIPQKAALNMFMAVFILAYLIILLDPALSVIKKIAEVND